MPYICITRICENASPISKYFFELLAPPAALSFHVVNDEACRAFWSKEDIRVQRRPSPPLVHSAYRRLESETALRTPPDANKAKAR
jgi:hypothetical protein